MLRESLRQLLHRVRAARVPLIQGRVLQKAAPFAVTTATTLVIAPHHDDETFGCGGLIALKRKAGADVHVVFVTDGLASHGQLDAEARRKLWQERRDEALAATAILGVAAERVHFLDFPDGGLTELPTPRREEAVARLGALMATCGPAEIFVCKRDDLHPDHEATYAITRDARLLSGSATKLFEYPIWIWWLRPLSKFSLRIEQGSSLKLDITSVRSEKDRATAVYRTQHEVLPPAFLRQFSGNFEVFFAGPSSRK